MSEWPAPVTAKTIFIGLFGHQNKCTQYVEIHASLHNVT